MASLQARPFDEPGRDGELARALNVALHALEFQYGSATRVAVGRALCGEQ
jgi:hypothetical protein